MKPPINAKAAMTSESRRSARAMSAAVTAAIAPKLTPIGTR